MSENKPVFIDAHVHIYPAEVSADPATWARARNELMWGGLVTPSPKRRVRQGWADCEQLLRDMDAAGIARSILLGWYWERQETCEWHNRYYLECIRAHPDRLSAFVTVQANSVDAALGEIEWAADNGFIGLGELCPHAFGTSLLDQNWMRVFRSAAQRGWPVNLHVADPVGRPYEGRVGTPLEEFVQLAVELPDLRLILAHWGGGLLFHEINKYYRTILANVCYDTAATPLSYDRGIYNRAVAAIGADRILFGSDYPLLVYPPDQREPDLRRLVADVRACELSPGTFAAVLGGNAARFI